MSASRIFKEPLFHFVLLGATLFALYAWVNPSSRGASENTILVSAGRIEQLASVFGKTWQRPPSGEELKGLIDDFVLEEVYYRKAVEMGIDQDDALIRRRLRQKLEFLTDDVIALATPSDADLEQYLSENAAEFSTDPTFTFRQIYFNPEKRGDDPLPEIRKVADELRAGGEAVGDRTLLPERLENASLRAIDGTFGTGFAAKLEKLAPGEWGGPISSGFGLHLVRLDRSTPGELPPLERIRPEVAREWANHRKVEARADFNAELLRDFTIEVEWPGSESESQPEE
jgi:hypothetical protein